VTVGLTATLVFTVWSLIAYRASDEAKKALAGDTLVKVTRGDAHWLFTPWRHTDPQTVGLLFFPGALVDPAAYASLAREIAREGYPVLLVELPRRAAFGGANGGEVLARARMALGTAPAVTQWVVAGHSKGAVVAARLVREGGPFVGGLVIVGSSHPRDFSLAELTIPVIKIVGTRDCVADLEKSERNRHLLPARTRWVVIQGGNHSQFGRYGFQPGDCFATIDRDRQQQLTIEAIVEAMQHVAGGDAVARR
jgi:pimeloyl-ACP methyl ester carboxylesterase